MAIPSGSGTEVLKRGYFTVTDTIDLYIDDGGGGTDYEILSDQAIGANETFVFNDRLVLTDEDHLCAAAASSANIDIVVSYLDQTR